MRQDRRLNGWVLLSSVLQSIVALLFIVAGAFVGVLGFLKPEQLLKIDDLTFFIYQEGIVNLQQDLLKGLLKTEFLYLALGVIVAVIGLIALIFAIISISYAKKRKVVQHKFALFIFTIIPIAIASCVGFYLFKEFDMLTDNIKYVCYGIVGVFGVITLFNIMGIMFGRSEKFMSNDNNKYAFDNSAIKNARVNVNNNVRDAQMHAQPQQYVQTQYTQQQYTQVQPNTQQYIQPQMQSRQPMYPNQSRMAQPNQVASHQAPRPQIDNRMQGSSRPVSSMSSGAMQPRPMQSNQMPPRPQPVRPIQPQNMQNQSSQPQASQSTQQNSTRQTNTLRSGVSLRPTRRCSQCGKALNLDDRICSDCGNMIGE
ncbi:MAG: hypothetical protein IJ371_04035 [Clostridia bacterium]|nr:hypothetical protein [Clostridia bacterium]